MDAVRISEIEHIPQDANPVGREVEDQGARGMSSAVRLTIQIHPRYGQGGTSPTAPVHPRTRPAPSVPACTHHTSERARTTTGTPEAWGSRCARQPPRPPLRRSPARSRELPYGKGLSAFLGQQDVGTNKAPGLRLPGGGRGSGRPQMRRPSAARCGEDRAPHLRRRTGDRRSRIGSLCRCRCRCRSGRTHRCAGRSCTEQENSRPFECPCCAVHVGLHLQIDQVPGGFSSVM